MSVFLKPTTMKIRNEGGEFQGFNVMAEKTVEETIASIPKNYTALSNTVSDLEDSVDILNSGGLNMKDEVIAENVSDWLDDHPEATTTVQDGSIAIGKLGSKMANEIRPLSMFEGSTDLDKLSTILSESNFAGSILGGDIVVDSPISLGKSKIRTIKIVNAIITLNSDLFITNEDYARLPSFINCHFVGNGNSIFNGEYGVFGEFIGCSFDGCSIVNNINTTIQSLYVSHCELKNSSNPFIKAYRLYDTRINNVLCSGNASKFIDTFDSSFAQGGTQNLWITNSAFESFSAIPLDLSGGNIYIKNCYFENNVNGSVKITKQENADNKLTLEITGCKINQKTNPFLVLQGFQKHYRVQISIHDNYYYANNTGAPMVSGMVYDSLFSIYNNAKTYNTETICADTLPIFDPLNINRPIFNTEYFTHYSGGFIQFGSIVIIDMKFKSIQSISSNVNEKITDIPKPITGNLKLQLFDGTTGDLVQSYVILRSDNTASIVGGVTANALYRIIAVYLTDNKKIQ